MRLHAIQTLAIIALSISARAQMSDPTQSPSPTPSPSETPSPVPSPTLSAPPPAHAPRFSRLKSGWNKEVTVDRIQNGQVYFKTASDFKVPDPIQIELENPEFLGVIRSAENDPPFLIIGGKKKSDQARFVYLIRADGGREPKKFVYPGKIRQKNGRLMVFTRSFFGKCMAKRGEIYLAYQKEKLRRRKYLQHSVFVAEPKGDRLEEQQIIRRRRLPSLKSILRRVRRKECTEIKGFNRRTLEFKIKRD